jgi:hypothetical protein
VKVKIEEFPVASVPAFPVGTHRERETPTLQVPTLDEFLDVVGVLRKINLEPKPVVILM